MYFLWKRTPQGSIRVSCDGLSGFIDRVLPRKSKCRGLSLVEGEIASVTLILSSDSSPVENVKIEERLAAIVAPLGICVQVVWVDRDAPEVEWSETLSSLCQSPWMWMLIASMIALGVMAGFARLFWTFFWGTAAWFISKIIISSLFKRKVGFFLSESRR
ncbi:MAG: hypothetical protein LBJ36_12125 [Synergistaceae bacterium]|nr:hypothetical protein [Synergistaceae bacterium]